MLRIQHMLKFSSLVLRIGRPLYVIPIVLSSLTGYLLASGEQVDYWRATLIIVGFFSLGLTTWAENELVDYGRNSNARTKQKWGFYVAGGAGLLRSQGSKELRSILRAVIFLAAVGLMSLALINSYVAIGGVLSLFCGIAYSVMPLRLKSLGVFGSVIVALASGSLTFVTGWAASQIPFRADLLWPVLAVSMLFLAADCIAHCIDSKEDRAIGDRTIAVQLGVTKTLWLTRILVTLCVSFLIVEVVRGMGFNIGISALLALATCSLGFSVVLLSRKSLRGQQLSIARLLSIPMICSSILLLFWV